MPASLQYIEDLLATFDRATQANWATPGREGNVIVLSPDLAEDVLVSADLHGHRRNYNLIQRAADLPGHPRRHLVMQEVCHGGPTYPTSGGCLSHTMLEDVARLKVRYPERLHFILSNHEWAEVTEYPILKNKRMLNLLFRFGLNEAYGPAADRVRKAYTEFLRSCPLAVRLPQGVLICHTAPENTDRNPFDATLLSRPLDPADWKEHSDLYWLLWGRDYRPENAREFASQVRAQVLVHGHEPCPEGFSVPNDVQVILDCSGDKACVALLPVEGPLTQADVVRNIKRL
jgi:hypothetical protein